MKKWKKRILIFLIENKGFHSLRDIKNGSCPVKSNLNIMHALHMLGEQGVVKFAGQKNFFRINFEDKNELPFAKEEMFAINENADTVKFLKKEVKT